MQKKEHVNDNVEFYICVDTLFSYWQYTKPAYELVMGDNLFICVFRVSTILYNTPICQLYVY